MKQTFKQINDRAMALPYNDLNNRIQTMCREAAENEATIGGDALAHLESSLCFSDDMAVCQWFAENDVAW